MRIAHPVRRRGFTLIELLTVIAIISLLIGVLVPAVSAARNSAKKASTQNLIESIGKGCEMFQRDFERYPRSTNMRNPFEPESANIQLCGAQWVILELAGADMQGYVAGDKYRYPDTDGDGTVNEVDWQKYYDPAFSDSFHRYGPYVQLDGRAAQSPGYFRDRMGATLPDVLDPEKPAAGTSDWNNGRLPFAVDAFGFPVLYYAANDQATLPFTDPADTGPSGEGWRPGRYTQWDNQAFTGSDYYGSTGIDLGGGTDHPLRYLGWAVATATTVPDSKSFAGAVYDRGLFEQNRKTDGTGKVWPHRPDTFIFISAGKDALYGTSDDVMNFEN